MTVMASYSTVATGSTMSTEQPTKPSQGQQLANVLLKCRAGLALSRTQAEEAVHLAQTRRWGTTGLARKPALRQPKSVTIKYKTTNQRT